MTAFLDSASPKRLLMLLHAQFYALMSSKPKSISRHPIANTLAHSKLASFACDLERRSTPSPGTKHFAVSYTAKLDV